MYIICMTQDYVTTVSQMKNIRPLSSHVWTTPTADCARFVYLF